jgi:hypothetical protein
MKTFKSLKLFENLIIFNFFGKFRNLEIFESFEILRQFGIFWNFLEIFEIV